MNLRIILEKTEPLEYVDNKLVKKSHKTFVFDNVTFSVIPLRYDKRCDFYRALKKYAPLLYRIEEKL